ncbi:MAG: LA2681 family HEPN domain-containing protein, partial [Desulfomonilaceae bacterium]
PTLGDQGLRSYFASKVDHIERHYKLEAINETFSLDASENNQNVGDEYRRWCLFSGLYLNTLNDIGPIELAAHDDLNLPNMVTDLGKAPIVVGLFNQLKQEFVSARWLYFEAVNSDEVHDSDLGVYLYNTLDYPEYGLAVEKLKISFRMAYSILDKVAYYLNRYLELGIAEKEVSFRGIWKQNKSSSTVRPEFNASKNWALRGLYWLSKDLFEPEFADVTDPDAQGLSKLRNHLEHKYVKVHLFAIPEPNASDMWLDDFAYSLTVDELEHRTLRLLRLVRAALIYFTLGVHAEERRRYEKLPVDALLGVFDLIPFEDERKRRN